MSKTEHTPLPWSVGPYGGIYRLNADGIHGPLIVSGETKNGTLPNKEGDEAFIVEAVNAYEAIKDSHSNLIEALEEVMEWISNWDVPFLEDEEWGPAYDKVSLALSKAKGGEA